MDFAVFELHTAMKKMVLEGSGGGNFR